MSRAERRRDDDRYPRSRQPHGTTTTTIGGGALRHGLFMHGAPRRRRGAAAPLRRPARDRASPAAPSGAARVARRGSEEDYLKREDNFRRARRGSALSRASNDARRTSSRRAQGCGLAMDAAASRSGHHQALMRAVRRDDAGEDDDSSRPWAPGVGARARCGCGGGSVEVLPECARASPTSCTAPRTSRANETRAVRNAERGDFRVASPANSSPRRASRLRRALFEAQQRRRRRRARSWAFARTDARHAARRPHRAARPAGPRAPATRAVLAVVRARAAAARGAAAAPHGDGARRRVRHGLRSASRASSGWGGAALAEDSSRPTRSSTRRLAIEVAGRRTPGAGPQDGAQRRQLAAIEGGCCCTSRDSRRRGARAARCSSWRSGSTATHTHQRETHDRAREGEASLDGALPISSAQLARAHDDIAAQLRGTGSAFMAALDMASLKSWVLGRPR